MEAIVVILVIAFTIWYNNFKRKMRRDYYRKDYLQSEAWQRKKN